MPIQLGIGQKIRMKRMSTISNKQGVDNLCSRLDALGITGEYVGDAASVKDELETLFAETETTNEWNSGSKKLQAQIEKIETRVQKLEEKAQQILENISDKNLEIDDKSDKLADFVTKLTKAQNEFQEDIKSIVKASINEAIENYNRNNGQYTFDNCFDQAFGKKLGSLKGDQNAIRALYENYRTGSSQITSATSEIQSSLNQVQNLQGQLDNINATKTILGDLKNSMDGMISEKELDLISANNIDISEKLKDGSNRYVFAQGMEDGKFHIYDLKSSRGASLARQYGKGNGFDIVENGNGYMYTGLKVVDGETENSKDVYYLSDVDGQKSVGMLSGEYKTVSPLSFDLSGDGIQTEVKAINYDIDGDGVMDKINDSGDAVLVFDKNKDGVAGADGSECFGDNTDLDGDGKADGYKNGFEALRALAQKENLINGTDDNVLDVNDIKILEDKYGLGIKKDGYNGETSSLIDSGITEINISSAETEVVENFDNRGNKLMIQEGAIFKINGEERQYADVWHQKLDGAGEAIDDGRYHLTMGSQMISMNDDLSEITFKTSADKFEDAFSNLQKNEAIQNIENTIKDLLSKSVKKDMASSEAADIESLADEINSLTSQDHLMAIRDTARETAKRSGKVGEDSDKKVEEAITNYWGSNVDSVTDEDIEEIKEQEKKKAKKQTEEEE